MSEPAVSFRNVGKMYKIYDNRLSGLLDALGLRRLVSRRAAYREFWALRGIDLELWPGERLGVIGRNGAGKSTLLKIVTGNLPPTEGAVRVNGSVQALLDIGGGLHPEFTGRENIGAALAYAGFSRSQLRAVEEEIADFTELGRFLDQPFKTYSLGMQSRLSFAIATSVTPEILIVDEVLGAGDAYFFTKSTARMRKLIEGGASVLLVSHALEQIIRFCDEAVWMDRGRIIMRGESVEVVKAYERFIRNIEDQRLVARNRKSAEAYDAFARDTYTEQIVVEIAAEAGADIREVTLLRDGVREDSVRVGDAQDANISDSAHIVGEDRSWSAPRADGDVLHRRLAGSRAHPGLVVFNLWLFYDGSEYGVEVAYRSPAPFAVSVKRGDEALTTVDLPARQEWGTERVRVPPAVKGGESAERAPRDLSRWPGEGSLLIENVRLIGAEGQERAVFEPGERLAAVIEVVARRGGSYPVIPAAVLYRDDGILVSNHPGDQVEMTVEEGEQMTFELVLDPLNLGDGEYVVSVGLFRTLSAVDASESYDLVDRSFGFRVTGNPPFRNGVFTHPSRWHMYEPSPSSSPRS